MHEQASRLILFAFILSPLAMFAKESKPTFNYIVEVKPAADAKGIQLSADFLRDFWKNFSAEIKANGLVKQVLDEGAAEPTAADDLKKSLILEVRFLNLKEGHAKGDKFSPGEARIEVVVFRMSDHKKGNTYKVIFPVKGPIQDEEQTATDAGVAAADAFHKQAKGMSLWVLVPLSII